MGRGLKRSYDQMKRVSTGASSAGVVFTDEQTTELAKLEASIEEQSDVVKEAERKIEGHNGMNFQ